jgi:Uma2 family endonuclease
MQEPSSATTVKLFLPILMASEIKLELIDGQIGEFANGGGAHNLICDRIVASLRDCAETGYEVFTSDTALACAAADLYVFPDACYTGETLDPHTESIVAPRLIVEVLSAQSVERDRIRKLDSYEGIPSVKEYLIVDSRRIWACVYRRQESLWTQMVYGRLGDTINLSAISRCSIEMAELYAGIKDL